jgi:hypothetical protein
MVLIQYRPPRSPLSFHRSDDRRLTIAEAVSPGTCLMRAKPQLANRVVRHGKWRAARWSCQIAGQGRTQI